ncbi:GTPase-activating protein GYP1 [Rhodotorula toruloides]|uniref:BY PROTMAP: gi/472582215/gb/EMS19911.1/ GTPase activating protein [Rhodosporidium toruloides NP11] gi/647399682/emb/CDR44592.1/ RHTO0S09e06722g1_1 [Rhodosporidium toruloides] n=1 Tax=Rhodotorula toruloides TaxID=5286 RepID=A0A0K3CR83_RHOTO|nr:GTPase-activating protein GYP1 [Rhodotorula toruloides]PRQ71653.1 Rab-GTPase-TBC domain-domain containing protein [Rhodotorula toruloides]
MPLWSRANPPASTGPSHTSSSTSPGLDDFVANHHRRSSSNLAGSYQSQASTSSTSLGSKRGTLKKERVRSSVRELDELGNDDEPWDEGSDDEESVAQLAGRMGSFSLSIPASRGRGPVSPGGATPSSPPAGSAGLPSASSPPRSAGSAWSFNPFSMRSPPPLPRQSSTASSLFSAPSPPLGAEAVAAALTGGSRSSPSTLSVPPSQPSPPKRGASYLAGASKVQEEADKQVREEERRKSLEEGEIVQEPEEMEERGEEREKESPEVREKGEGFQKERWKQAVRQDVDELVHDPAHVLARLRVAWQPAPPPAQTHAHRASVSSVPDAPSPDPNATPQLRQGAHGPGSDDEDDLAAGYVQLNAPAVSSQDPSIVEFDAAPPNPEEEGERGRENRRKRKFLEVLGEDNVDLTELRKLAWSGVPADLRTMVWQLLLGYLPAPLSRRATTLARKRSEYASLVKQAFSRGVKGLDGPIWHQISIDVPRTRPGVLLWQAEATQRSLERILYVWAIRHPASGYVQGINDLVTPFFQVFLAAYIDGDPETFDVSVLPPAVLEALEADSFWCLSKLLDGIQDNYIFAQPGIQRLVKKMESLCARVDAPLAAHLKEQGVEFIQFAFRWMNCLLMRELSVWNIVRMWDTYLAEGGDAFSEFHLYVCLAFLVRWSDKLREMDFQSIIIFLQSLPTQDWCDKDTELLLSEAFLWSRTFNAR